MASVDWAGSELGMGTRDYVGCLQFTSKFPLHPSPSCSLQEANFYYKKESFSFGFGQCRVPAGAQKAGGVRQECLSSPLLLDGQLSSSMKATVSFSCHSLQIPVNCSLFVYLQALGWEQPPSFARPQVCTLRYGTNCFQPNLPTDVQIVPLLKFPQMTQTEQAMSFLPQPSMMSRMN